MKNRKKLRFKKLQKTKEHRNSKKRKTESTKSKSQQSSNHSIAYTNADVEILLGYSDIYPEYEKPELESLLSNIPRNSFIDIFNILTIDYCNKKVKDIINIFFSSNSYTFKSDFQKRFQKLESNNDKYIFCSLQTPIELLKFAFSLPYNNSHNNIEEQSEEQLLKAILIINENLMKFHHETKDINNLENLAKMFVVNSFSQKDINAFDYNDSFREVFAKSIDFFEYADLNDYFKPIYVKFLEKIKINNYVEYIKTILGLYILIMKGQRTIICANGQLEDPDNIISKAVLDYISLPITEDIAIEQNIDYKAFRNKPLIKFADNKYTIINFGFLIDRLFYSLYFDFKIIGKELKLNDFDDMYKQNFMEKTLLCKYLSVINSNQRYKTMSSNNSLSVAAKGDNGEPDYYMNYDNKAIILFENKDILINGNIKESRNSDKIISEYKNKLLLKAHNDQGALKNPKPIGIGQLVEQIKKIQNNKAFWDESVSPTCVIYPVIVINDHKILPDGLSYLLDLWYHENCKSEKINCTTVRPLIILSIATLLIHSDEFQKNGFEHYFELYYKSINNAKNMQSENMLLNLANIFASFSDFMKKTSKTDLERIHSQYINKIIDVDNK